MAGSRKTVLVTGASTGIGLALARRLVELPGYHPILTARASSLPRFAAAEIAETERIWLRPLDVTEPEQRAAVVSEAEERLGGIDVLVNNAGVAFRAVTEHTGEKNRLAQMDINFLAPMELARLVLPSMRRKRDGRIINVSSVGGMMAMPTMAIYSASKFALEGATEALYYEVKPWNIKVTLLQPGFIHSTAFKNTRFTSLSGAAVEAIADPYYNHYKNMGPFIARWMGRAYANPDRIARRIVKTMRRRWPPLRVQATIDARIFALLRRLVPQRIYHWALYRSLPRVRTWGIDSADVALLRGDTDPGQPPGEAG